jgi:hypothetical protein
VEFSDTFECCFLLHFNYCFLSLNVDLLQCVVVVVQQVFIVALVNANFLKEFLLIMCGFIHNLQSVDIVDVAANA